MNILVTGGAGFIGSHVVDLLIRQKHNVFIIDNLSSGKKENINLIAKFYHRDLSNYEEIEKIFEENKIEIVYHLAAQVNVRKSILNPSEDAKQNVLNTIKLLELCVKYKVKHFVFSSTGGAIYGNDVKIPTPETEKEVPISPYGCSKLSVEKYLNFFSKVYGLKYTCLRYSNVYGPRQNPESEAGVISVFFQRLFSNKKCLIFGGIQKRDFVYVEDVARANLLALKDEENQIYNVSSGKEIDIIEIFSKISKYFEGALTPEYKEMIKGEMLRSCLDYSKIKDSLGWEPSVKLEEGLDRVYCWYVKKMRR